MHYMHYKDYIHHGLAAEKTPLPCHRGGEPSGWVGGCVGVPAHIYIYLYIQNYLYIYIIYLRGGTRKVGEQERNRRNKKGERARKKT